MIEHDLQALEANQIIHTLVAYYLYTEHDYNTLLKMLNKTKSHEMLALKMLALV